jgi:hypothetical protein
MLSFASSLSMLFRSPSKSHENKTRASTTFDTRSSTLSYLTTHQPQRGLNRKSEENTYHETSNSPMMTMTMDTSNQEEEEAEEKGISLLENSLSLASTLSLQSCFDFRAMRDNTEPSRRGRKKFGSLEGDPFTLKSAFESWLEVCECGGGVLVVCLFVHMYVYIGGSRERERRGGGGEREIYI